MKSSDAKKMITICSDDKSSCATIDLEALAEANHCAWLELQRDTRKWEYGPQYSKETRTNPFIRDYSDLDEETKSIDRHTALSVVRALLTSGYTISPAPEKE
ncbi:RyR domain-containing protein [Pseudodesulfovibrio sp.]|uniref:RyR domain-containing protein n=1 Tax=unclassified Pseudodesulfovibrio TaxID=2661612 RepID=UPI003AFFF42D